MSEPVLALYNSSGPRMGMYSTLHREAVLLIGSTGANSIIERNSGFCG